MFQPSKNHVQEIGQIHFKTCFSPQKNHVQEIGQIHFKTCFSPQMDMFRKCARFISRHVSVLKWPCSGNTPDKLQDMFQTSNGHVQEVRQIHFKICFSPQRPMFRKYARYISRHASALKGPCSGNTPDAFQDMIQPSKGHVQGVRQIHFKTGFIPQRAIFTEYGR
jgi:hypothetical protein